MKKIIERKINSPQSFDHFVSQCLDLVDRDVLNFLILTVKR